MQILRHIAQNDAFPDGVVLTMGNFDGIHLGHRALVENAVLDAKHAGLPSVVLTFEPHPLRVLAPQRAPRMLLQHKDKMQLLQACGVDHVMIQTFDESFAKMSARTFVEDFLVGRLGIKKIWVGRDLKFGQGRKGSVVELEAWGKEFGYSVGVVEPVLVEGARVSSSLVRQLVNEGQVDRVEGILGRFHFISGKVVQGHQRGRVLGFPTANIASRAEILPKDGIYATLIDVAGVRYRSVSSIGLNPTFGEGPRTIETYILDFSKDIYGATVRLSFVKRIRDEVKFTTVENLITQIRADVAAAELVLAPVPIVS